MPLKLRTFPGHKGKRFVIPLIESSSTGGDRAIKTFVRAKRIGERARLSRNTEREVASALLLLDELLDEEV